MLGLAAVRSGPGLRGRTSGGRNSSRCWVEGSGLWKEVIVRREVSREEVLGGKWKVSSGMAIKAIKLESGNL